MAEKAHLFHEHRALELILSTSEAQSHKGIKRSVRGFDNAVWERERENDVLAGTVAKFSQNPGTKHHLLGTGNKILAETSPFDQVWGIGLRANDPDAHEPHLWRGKKLLRQALSTVRDLLRHNADGLAPPSSSPRFLTSLVSEGIHYINPTPLTRLRVSARACLGPPSECSTHSSDAPADHSPDGLAVAPCAAPTLADTPSLPEHGPGLVGGTVTLDDASSTTKIIVHSGTTAFTVFDCVVLLDTDSSQAFICRDVLEKILVGGAAAVNCKKGSAPRSWGGFGKSDPLRTWTSVHVSVQSSALASRRAPSPCGPASFRPRLCNTRCSWDAIAGCVLTRDPTALSLPAPLTKAFPGS